MEFYAVSIRKTDLDKIPELDRAFFVHIGHLRNEVMIIERLLWGAQNNLDAQAPPGPKELLDSFNVGQTLIITRLLAGKLLEGWELVQRAYYRTRVSEKIESQLPSDALASLRELKNYFSRSNNIHLIRNQFAFHYSPENIRDQLSNIHNTYEAKIYVSEYALNMFYQFSELIANTAMLDAVQKGNYAEALDKVTSEVLDMAKHFTSFCDGCLHFMIEKYLMDNPANEKPMQIILSDVPELNDIRLPEFIEKSETVK
ncbi:MAG: hypothetical protein L0220_31845 [Acidobacteria bacterium]|nr:hypothetical protein [Acidobacteriota bacterium]